MRTRTFPLFCVFFCGAVFAGTPDAARLLRDAEMIRNPQVDYQVDVRLKDTKNGKSEERLYQTSIKGRTKAIVKFIAPDVDRGIKLLMVEEQMWIQMPSSAKPIRISAK